MPNRIIKESICTSEEINSLDDLAECFFYRLIVNCDDFGLLDARPAILKAKCYPLKSIDINCIQMLLGKLQAIGLIRLYSVDGKNFLLIKSWNKHQQVRAKRAKFPLPTDDYDINCNQLISDASNCTRNPIQSNPIQSESNPISGAKETKRPRFTKPSISEIADYCTSRSNAVNPQLFFDHYESNGWHVGKNPMRDWKAAIRTWETNSSGGNGYGKNQHTSKPSLAERATNARKEFERSIGIGDTIQATDGELVGAHEPPVRP